MKFSHDSLLTVTLRVVCGLVLVWVLIALPPGASALNTPQRSSAIAPVGNPRDLKTTQRANPRSYLAMVGPVPLRFALKAQPLPPEPTLPEPPSLKQPANTPEAETKSADTPNTPTTLGQTPSSSSPSNTSTPKLPIEPTPASETSKPVSILPDDTKIEIRPEDVLPFFSFPGGGNSEGPTTPFSTTQPRASTAPPSSATYRQQ